MYNYHREITNDIINWLNENPDVLNENPDVLNENPDVLNDYRADLEELLWLEDGVTGNASGSYTFSAYDAERNLAGHWDLLLDAMSEFGDDRNPLYLGAEACDVIIRCYLLGECIGHALNEILGER